MRVTIERELLDKNGHVRFKNDNFAIEVGESDISLFESYVKKFGHLAGAAHFYKDVESKFMPPTSIHCGKDLMVKRGKLIVTPKERKWNK
jgi:hypothetical protein